MTVLKQNWHERNKRQLKLPHQTGWEDEVKGRIMLWQAMAADRDQCTGSYRRVFPCNRKRQIFPQCDLRSAANICIIRVDDKGERIPDLLGPGKWRKTNQRAAIPSDEPWSEKQLTDGRHRVIYHAPRPTPLPWPSCFHWRIRYLQRELWEMATECPVVFPDGIGCWLDGYPGGRDIAVATSELMKNMMPAIWAHHGMFCSGGGRLRSDLWSDAYGGEICGDPGKRCCPFNAKQTQTITPQNFRDLAKRLLKVTLPEEFLYESRKGARFPCLWLLS